jgi:hypothetical protein
MVSAFTDVYHILTSSAAEGSTLSSLAWGRVLSTNTACSAFAGSGMSSTYTASPVTWQDRTQTAVRQNGGRNWMQSVAGLTSNWATPASPKHRQQKVAHLHVCRDVAVGFTDNILVAGAAEVLQAAHWSTLIAFDARGVRLIERWLETLHISLQAEACSYLEVLQVLRTHLPAAEVTDLQCVVPACHYWVALMECISEAEGNRVQHTHRKRIVDVHHKAEQE